MDVIAEVLDATAGDAAEAMRSAEATFLRAYPAYRSTRVLDRLRAEEYGRLDAGGHVYLDYTGGGLYADSQIRDHMTLLRNNVFGNPHSRNPTALAMTRLVERAKQSVLDFFRAAPDEYIVAFTPNASGALKLVGESYPFAPGGQLLLLLDNHNSVHGIREFARARGADVAYLPLTRPELRLDPDATGAALRCATGEAPRLFAFPAQSNFTGVQHPLAWVERAQAHGWDVLLDAAAFAPTNRLDLSVVHPDFVCISFYKMFGYPTGVGALLARRTALARLRRPWFAGGTVAIASVSKMSHHPVDGGAAFEDGTVDYLNLPAVDAGLAHLTSPGMEMIHERVTCLIGWLVQAMAGLRHTNARPMVQIHGPLTTEARGGTVAFNLYDPHGQGIDARRIEELATAVGISLRTGFFCNPGVGELAHGITSCELDGLYGRGCAVAFQDLRELMQAQHQREIATIRVSVGIASTFADVYRFLTFLATLRDRPTAEVGAVQSAAHGGAMATETT